MENNHYDSTGDVLNVKDRFAGHSVRRRIDGRRIPVMIAGVFCAALAVVCLSGFTYILFLQPSGSSMNSRYYAQAATRDISDNRADVTLPLYVPDLDVRGSRVPVRVDGTLADGSEFGQDAFVSNDGKGLRLAPGSYDVYVMGSPISASGVMYIYPTEHINVVVSEDLNVSYDPVTFMTFGVLGALEVSDEQIEQARAFIVNDPDRMQYADTLAAAVRERREEAQKELEAQNAARQEAAKVVAEQKELKQNEQQNKNENAQKQESADSQTNYGTNTSDDQNNSGYGTNTNTGSQGTESTDGSGSGGTSESTPTPSTEPSADVDTGGSGSSGGGTEAPTPVAEPSTPAPVAEPVAPATPVSVDVSADAGGAAATPSGMAG